MNSVFISRYRILEEIGRGGMGVVYKAEDPRLERLVAVKTLPPKLLRNKEALRRFLREAKVAAKLDHPHIIPIYDVGEDNGIYYMVMEYLEGTTLRDWMEVRPEIDVKKSLAMFTQIAKALDYAHQRKVVHRDIKPDNIMVVSNEMIKVMDFGIAVMDDRHSVTQPGAVVGTIAYISPEQAKGKQADIRSDIYSLGIVLFEFLTGQLPFHAETPSQMLAHHLSTPPPLPSSLNANVSKALDQVVLKSLEKDPDTRYQSVASLLEDLEETLVLEKPEEKFIASSAEKEVFESVESFLSLNPASPSAIDLDKTKILEGLKALLSRQAPEREKEEAAQSKSSSDLSQDSFAKYRLVVERIQKDLVALNERMSKSEQDNVELKAPETGKIPVEMPLPPMPSVPVEVIEPGIEIYRAGRYAEAVNFFSDVVKKDPKCVDAYFYLGMSQFQLKHFREALTAYRKGTELDGTHGLMWLGLGDAASALSHDLEALQAYQQAVQYIPAPELWRKLGKIEENLGHLDKARRALSKALELAPEDQEAQKSLVQVLIGMTMFQEALDLIKKNLALHPENADFLRLLGLIYEHTDHYSQALQAYEKALSINPADSQVLAQLGKLHEKQNEPDKAMDRFMKAAQAQPENPEVYTKLASLHLKRKEDDRAITFFEKASGLTPNDSGLHKELGKLYFKKNELDQAMVQFEWTIALDPADPEAHGKLGQIYYKKDQAQLSIREYKTAIHLDPYNPEFYENLGMVYYIEEDFDNAIEQLKRAITLDPGNVDYRKALGVIYETKGKFDLARKEYQKVVEAAPKDYLAQGLLGRVYLEQDLVHLAIFQFQKALNLEPRSFLMQNLLGKAYLRLGQAHEAVEAFRKALENAPEPNTPRGKQIVGKTCFYLGRSLLESTQIKEAESVLAKSVQLLPTFAKAFHFLGKAQYLLGDRETSRRNLEQAARLSSQDVDIFVDLAEMLAQGEDYPGAIFALEKAVEIEPEHAPYYGFLGDLQARLGDTQQAIRSYQQALMFEKSKKGLYHSKLGNLFMQKKDYAEGAAQFKTAIDLSPENWHYHQDLAKAYKAMGKIEEAVLELERAKTKSLNSDVLSLIEEEIGRLKKKK